ncbi:hypothetical protein ccbrp13_23200 [Ktedonobacteria bacterium brp13]|nr:hypothetical protein ccbrp13_23200 [Ktedonobacteria bacterium brp13]
MPPQISKRLDVQRQPQRPVFRSRAVEHYMRKSERSVLPNVLRPLFFTWLWLLLLLACLLGALVSLYHWPVQIQSTGMFLAPTAQHPTVPVRQAVFFLPATIDNSVLSPGDSVQIQLQGVQQKIVGRITQAPTTILTVSQLRQRFAPLGSPLVPTQPARIIIVTLDETASTVLKQYTAQKSISTAQLTTQLSVATLSLLQILLSQNSL